MVKFDLRPLLNRASGTCLWLALREYPPTFYIMHNLRVVHCGGAKYGRQVQAPSMGGKYGGHITASPLPQRPPFIRAKE